MHVSICLLFTYFSVVIQYGLRIIFWGLVYIVLGATAAGVLLTALLSIGNHSVFGTNNIFSLYHSLKNTIPWY